MSVFKLINKNIISETSTNKLKHEEVAGGTLLEAFVRRGLAAALVLCLMHVLQLKL